jgi:hypothetical protein
MTNNLKIYCVTNKIDPLLDDLFCDPAGVGKEKFPSHYQDSKSGDNIHHKDPSYAECIFHYWFWKNKLKDYEDNFWIGFCQYRRYWLKENYDKDLKITRNNLKDNELNSVPPSWSNYDSVIASKINLDSPKFMKILKRGYKNLLKDPSIIFDKKKHTVKLHFDMFHGYGNLDKAIDLLNKSDRDDFREYVNTSTSFSPTLMFITHPKIMKEWCNNVFDWLFKCEEIFGFKNFAGYDLHKFYGFLAERYLSYWFNKYTNPIEWPWVFVDLGKERIKDS